MNLPRPLIPNASYVPTAQLGELLVVSGQLAFDDEGGMPVTGRLGAEHDVEAGQQAARRCARHFLAQVQAALGTLDAVERILKLTVFVAATPEFDRHHLVANGASDLLVEVLGERGRHTRSAFGVSGLPFGSPVEIEGFVVRQSSAAKGTS
jgi:enamine deaminase RidA (YjgF/YER057c/UK114 family)